MVRVLVDSRLRFATSSVPAEALAELRAACTYDDPAYGKLARMARRNRRLAWRLRNTPATVTTWREDGDEFSLPRGATRKVRETFARHGLRPSFVDLRVEGTGPRWPEAPRHRPAPSDPDGGALRWYQREAVDAALDRQNAILRAPTGSGKTTSAIALAMTTGLPTLIVVWSSGLYTQWEERIHRELGVPLDDIGRVRGSRRDVRPITIAMQQSLWRGMTPEFVGLWGCVICDEVQRAAARTFIDVFDRFPAKYRIGVSADESRADRKEFLVYDLFGEVAHEVSQDDLIAEGAVLDVECRLVPTEFRADWYVRERAAGLAPDFHRLLEEMQRDDERNALVVDLVRAEVAAGQQALVLSHRVEHSQRFDAAISARGIPCDVMLGGDDWRERFDATKRGLSDGSLRVGCGTIQAVGTGIDLPALGRGVLATPIGSNRQLYGQVRGRLCRPEKSDAVLYVLWDRHVHGESTLRNMLAWNRSVVVRSDDGTWVEGREYLRRSDGST